MGTNFYLKSKQPRVIEVYDEYHIAKTSSGWVPLFDPTESGCESVAEIKREFDSGKWDIVDEYGDSYSWDGFKKKVLEHCPDGRSHKNELEIHIDSQGYEFADCGFC